MTTNLENQLRELANLDQYINNCPESSRELVVAQEISLRARVVQEHNDPLMALRWLNFNLKSLKYTKSLQTKALETGIYKNLYYESACKCESLIAAFANKNRNEQNIKDENKLQSLIEKQQPVILKKYLSEATLQYLENYKNNPYVPFSAKEILADAINKYKNSIFREALFQFETINLIECYDILKQKNEFEQKDRKNYYLHVRDVIESELTFIGKLFSNRDLTAFKLEGTQLLYDYLNCNISPKKITEIYNEIDTRIRKGQGSKEDLIIKKTFDKYFNTAELTTIFAHMSEALTLVEKFVENIRLLEPSVPVTILTTDENLRSLRTTVSDYLKRLDNIETYEKRTYINRNDNALVKRKKALTFLSQCIDQVDKLTPETKKLAQSLVHEIRENEPRWVELSFINKILDIITLGLNALCRKWRNTTVPFFPPEIRLENIVKKQGAQTNPYESSVIGDKRMNCPWEISKSLARNGY